MSTSINRISGLISGFDTDSLVTKLLSGEQAKLDQLKQKQQILEWQQEGYRDTNLKLLAFRNSLSDLKLASSITGKKVTTTDDSVLTATATSDAANGTHIVKINSLVSGVNRISTVALSEYKDTLAEQFGLSGTISFSLKGKDGVEQTYSFDTSTKSINDVVTAINANASTTGISAGYSSDGNRFVLATTDQGAEATIEVVSDDTSFLKDTLKLGLETGTTYNGTDASIDFDGATGITFKSNQFTLNDIKFNLTKAGETVAVTVANDTEGAVAKIKAFVDAYNALVENINSKLHESRAMENHQVKYQPLTDAQKKEMSDTDIKNWEAQAKKGIMNHESLLQSILAEIRTTVNNILTNSSHIETMTSNVNLSSKATLNSYADTLNEQFGINGMVSFTLKGKDGVAKTYSFDTTTEDINAVVGAINSDTANSGIKATYSTKTNSFSLTTLDDTSNIEIVSDGDSFLKTTLKLGVNAGVYKPTTNLVDPSTDVSQVEYRSLSAIGITTGTYVDSSNDNGKLTIDTDALTKALQDNAEDVFNLFNLTQTVLEQSDDGTYATNTYNVGIITKLSDTLTNAISQINSKAGSGDTSVYDDSYMAKDIARIDELIAAQEDRMQTLEDYYYARFTAMEQAIQQANTQASWLSQFGSSNTSSS